ncbi:MAG: NFACT family protein [Lachnospiraceae bacterium]|nr:NFACT family protein [Lachnospiraceae bacterium]
MAFDGITIAALAHELKQKITDGRISKITQPEKDEIVLQIKSDAGNFLLSLSANPTLPMAALTQEKKNAPLTAPAFCMLLRKHISGGRIRQIIQPGLERILEFLIEHLDEMGDLCQKRLIIELMGKHSNIIFCDDKGMVLDAIKHVSAAVSSVREVLPGREYFRVLTQEKTDLGLDCNSVPNAEDTVQGSDSPSEETARDSVLQKDNSEQRFVSQDESFIQSHTSLEKLTGICENVLFAKPMPAVKAVYQSFVGFSPAMAQELLFASGIDGDRPFEAASTDEKTKFCHVLYEMLDKTARGEFSPCLVTDKGTGAPLEFGVFNYRMYPADAQQSYESVSELLYAFYGAKSKVTRIRQKSSDLRHIVTVALERCSKKYDLQIQQLKDTEKREKYKVYGELLHTYGYQASEGDKSITALNYYTNEEITIPLDPEKTAMENASRYFERYQKLKRTYEFLSEETQKTAADKYHLESVLSSLEMAQTEDDLAQIRAELTAAGYIRAHGREKGKARKTISKPLHYISSDGYDIYVGKNNFQNEEITFQLAKGNDWWFHAKKRPGSHVILRAGNTGEEIPDRAFEEAAALAAHFSKSDGQTKVEVDYIQKKHVKKPAGANPGFVVYYTNYSMLAGGDISHLRLVEEV